MSDPRPSGSAAKIKAKPRANVVRKSKAERDAHAAEEAEKAAARAAAAVQAAGKPTQTNKPKKREQARDNRSSNQGSSGGVFGAGTGVRQVQKRSEMDTGHSEMLEGQEAVIPTDGPALQGQEGGESNQGKRTGASSTSGGRASKFIKDKTELEADDEPEESRRDIERIEISSSDETDEDGPVTDKGKAKAANMSIRPKRTARLRPVRAPRALNIDIKDEDDEDEEVQTDRRDETRAVKSSRAAIGDPDGQDDPEEMDTVHDQIEGPSRVKPDVPSSPELSKRTKPSRRLESRAKESRLGTETIEDKAERLRMFDDVEKFRQQFKPSKRVKNDEDMEEDNVDPRSDRKYFLFQFPPLVPFLADEASISSAGQDSKQQATQSGPTIKRDPEGAPQPAPTVDEDDSGPRFVPPEEGILTASESVRLPPGRIGKLRVHKSGKVTLDWGGTNMEVRYGTEVNFLQDAVLIETPPKTGESEDNAPLTGTTYALGPVQKKMVVVPDWQKLYG